jgi:hypothetical protein
MPDLSGWRVLVVEDDQFIAREVRRGFEPGGAAVLGPVGPVRDALVLRALTDRTGDAVLDADPRGAMVVPVAEVLRARQPDRVRHRFPARDDPGTGRRRAVSRSRAVSP